MDHVCSRYFIDDISYGFSDINSGAAFENCRNWRQLASVVEPRMKELKYAGIAALVGGSLTKNDILFIISIILTVLGMVQTYLENRKNGR